MRNKFSNLTNEKLISKYKETEKMSELCAFNNKNSRSRNEIDSCFLKSEIIKRGLCEEIRNKSTR